MVLSVCGVLQVLVLDKTRGFRGNQDHFPNISVIAKQIVNYSQVYAIVLDSAAVQHFGLLVFLEIYIVFAEISKKKLKNL